MKYLTVNGCKESFKISKMALGTGSAMKELSQEEVFKLFDIYYEAGGNVFDTAPGYNGGRSEQNIGQWIKKHNNRDQVIISTKACHTFEGEPSRLSLKDMQDDLNQSLSQLQVDYIDLFWIHNDDLNWPVSDIINSVNKIIDSGKIRAVGCSNWTIERIEEANKYAKENGLHGFWANQIQWSLARVEGDAYKKAYGALVMNEKNYNWYCKNNINVFAFSALAQGFFAMAAANGVESLPENTRKFFETPDNLVRLERVKEYMKEHNVPSSIPVLGYLINNKLPGVALMSAQTPEILLEALAAADTDMTQEEVDKLFYV